MFLFPDQTQNNSNTLFYLARQLWMFLFPDQTEQQLTSFLSGMTVIDFSVSSPNRTTATFFSVWQDSHGCCFCFLTKHTEQQHSYLSGKTVTDVSVSWPNTQNNSNTIFCLARQSHMLFLFPGCLSSWQQAKCISQLDLPRQFHVLPHWQRSCRRNLLSHPYWHWANQSSCWLYTARYLAEWMLFVGCLMSQQHASVSWGRIYLDILCSATLR